MRLFDRLHGIRWRFTLMTVALGVLGVSLREVLLMQANGATHWRELGRWGPPALVAVVMFWMAHRLATRIEALRRSVESVAAGETEASSCEGMPSDLGRLADSVDRMTSRIDASAQQVHALAFVDPGTGLPNRRWVDLLLAHALAHAGHGHAAIIFIGLDGHERINDLLGRSAGDELLQRASRRIEMQGLGRSFWPDHGSASAIGDPCEHRLDDVVLARYGATDFVALLPGAADRAALAALGERIVTSLGEPFVVGDQTLRIGASVGVALAPCDTGDMAELLAFADQTMRGARQAGGARCRFFARQNREAQIELARTEAELALAITRHELVLHYQPTVSMGTQQLVGVEALVRWRHPSRGLLGPQEFIDVAERAGLMPALGRQVLRLAVAQCRSWSDEGLPLAVAVNVSPLQFSEPDFVDQVLGVLHEAQVPAERLTVEITESMAMADFEATTQRLAELRSAGVKVALDDFGIGYSNFAQLARLPLDLLKIDRSLVQGLGQDGRSEAIVRAMVGVTHALGCRSVAEGIETEQQRACLQGLKCDIGQGHLFGRAMPAQAFVAWHFRWAHDVAVRQRRLAAARTH